MLSGLGREGLGWGDVGHMLKAEGAQELILSWGALMDLGFS